MDVYKLVSNNRRKSLPWTGILHAEDGCNAFNNKVVLIPATKEQQASGRWCENCRRKRQRQRLAQ